jgi:hypothetical protein
VPTNLLTDSAVKRAKPIGKPRKLFDGGGLYILIKPNGARLWRLKYRCGGVEKLLALGAYPEVTLKRAREKRAEARQLLDRQCDPSALRKARRQAARVAKDNTFIAVAEEWFSHYQEQRRQAQRPLSPATVVKTQWLLNLAAYRGKNNRGNLPHALRSMSDRPIHAITKDDIGTVINALKRRNSGR